MANINVNGHTYSIEGILFDKDGTLLEFYVLWQHWLHSLYKLVAQQFDKNMNLSFATLADALGLDLQKSQTDPKGPLAIGTTKDIASIFALYLYQRNVPWNEAVQTIQHSYEKVDQTLEWERYLHPVKGLFDFLQTAHQHSIKMGVVTADQTKQAESQLSKMNIRSKFDVVIGSDQVERGKPFPDMGYLACRMMAVSPEKVFVIGDTNGDMLLGKNLQARASIGIATHKDDDRSHLVDADHIIFDYTEISIR